MDTLGLYIHIPFCTGKCHYCDFASYPDRLGDADKYIGALLKEAQLNSDYLSGRIIDTVFIGGGTPSVLSPEQMSRLMEGLNSICNIDAFEITIEANPESIDREKVTTYKDHGINRLSIGLQSHDNKILKNIGRRHKYDDFINAYRIAGAYFNNINIDTIFGLPGQTVQNYTSTIEKLTEIEPEHISCYALKLEDGTKLHSIYSGADEDTDRQMYHKAVELLKKAGYSHYETSNFARPGYECAHNLKYWQGREYLGLGAAASSYDLKSRKTNTRDLYRYFEDIENGRLPVSEEAKLTDKDREQEYIMLRLRLSRGISFKDYNETFDKDFLAEFGTVVKTAVESGLIIEKSDRIVPTLKGFDLQNYLITEFMKNM